MSCTPSPCRTDRAPLPEPSPTPDDRESAILYLRVASRCGDPLEREVLRRRAAELLMPQPVRPREGTPA